MEKSEEKTVARRWQGWLLVACITTAVGLMTIGYWTSPGPQAVTPSHQNAQSSIGSPTGQSGGQSHRLRLAQRSGTSLPIPEGGRLRLGDITRGRVSVYVANAENRLIAEGVMRTGMRIQFFTGDAGYWLELVDLDNHLVGNDYATFVISSDQPSLTEDQKIDRLIAFVEGMKDATFIRNDDTYSPEAAANHLRRKLSYAGQSITAEQFITEIASRSSSSGEAYRVRYADGREAPFDQVLREELARLESARP